jgi:glycosyltransferase involved in cell wall biosynthesis
MSAPDLSIVIPVSQRSDGLGRILEHIRGGLAGTGKTFEVLLVVDGELPQRLEEARKVAEADPDIRVLRFSRRFGEGAALQAGLGACRAPCLLTHPAYFEVEANVIPKLVAAVDGGADLAFASRLPRTESILNRLQRWSFNALVRRVLGLRFRDTACGARVLRAETLQEISAHGAFHRFITVAAAMSGYDVVEVETAVHPEARRPRFHSPLTYLRRLLDIANVYFVTKFLYKPLRFFGVIGGLLFVPGFLICLYLTILKIFTNAQLGNRPLFLFGVILAVLGFQVTAIGLLGEIISFSQATRRRPYAVKEIVRREGTATKPEPDAS